MPGSPTVLITGQPPEQLLTVLSADPAWPQNGRPFDLGLYYNTLNSLDDNVLEDEVRALVTLPMGLVVDAGGKATPVLSVFNLIAMLGHVMDCRTEREIADLLRSSAQLRSFPVPSSDRQPEADVELYTDDPSEEDRQDGPINDPDPRRGVRTDMLSKVLWKWVEQVREEGTYPLPVYAVARMWTRFYYTLDRCDAAFRTANGEPAAGEMPSETKSPRDGSVFAGQALHRFLVAFLNAVLVEEVLFSPRSVDMNLRNPVGDDNSFLENLRLWRGSRNESRPSLFRHMWGFPLWSFYLDPESEIRREHSAFLQKNGFPVDTTVSYTAKSITVPNLFPLFNTLLIHRPEHLSVPLSAAGRE